MSKVFENRTGTVDCVPEGRQKQRSSTSSSFSLNPGQLRKHVQEIQHSQKRRARGRTTALSLSFFSDSTNENNNNNNDNDNDKDYS